MATDADTKGCSGPLWCIVPAAGRGARFGGAIPKQYLPLAGRPLILHTLERLAAHPRVAGLMVVLAAHDRWWPDVRQVNGKPVRTAIGGSERVDSVLAGLRALPDEIDATQFVLVHDAARPCLRYEDLGRLIAAGTQAGGALLGAPLRDTLKRVDGHCHSIATEAREARWRAFTPQLFRRGELTLALERARSEGVAVTDEAMAMERTGHRPLLVEGAEDNIKVTTPSDLKLAEFLLERTL
ncbi:MAG TPA: 2-C-methyl-D-erythritol 4-phosphate cytidylyltransferase [Rhodanobacteraceae bacterium]|nr:2-C-methyl-D-erythritol 4-phosphate cytidylyltransferase [Rhodanobacteraceae bacterium]